MIKRYLFLLFFTFTMLVNADEIRWNIQDCGTLSTFIDAYVKEFNDCGQVLIAGRKQGETYTIPQPHRIEPLGQVCSWGVWTPEAGLMSINYPIKGPLPYSWHRINGQGLVVGLSSSQGHDSTWKNIEYYSHLITWLPGIGIKSYRLPLVNGAAISSREAYIAQCRNSDSVIVTCMYDTKKGGSYESRVFSLIDDKLQDLTPILRQQAKALGYDAGDLLIITSNSDGTMLGRFDIYQINPYKGGKNAIGTKYFLWNNIEMVLVDNPEEFPGLVGREHGLDAYHTFLDSNNRVLFDVFVENLRYKQSWIWSRAEGLMRLYPEECLQMAPGRGWAHAIGLLDNGTILWTVNNYDEFNGFLFQRENQQVRLPLDKYRQPLPEHIGDFYDIRSTVSILNGTWPLNDKYLTKNGGGEFNANSLNQVFFTGKFLGEEHPFFIEPAGK
jgi:hypothetical protein